MDLKLIYNDDSSRIIHNIKSYEEVLSVGDVVEFVDSSAKLAPGAYKPEEQFEKGTLAVVHLTFDQYAFYQYQVHLSEIARYNVKSEWIRKIGEKTK